MHVGLSGQVFHVEHFSVYCAQLALEGNVIESKAKQSQKTTRLAAFPEQREGAHWQKANLRGVAR